MENFYTDNWITYGIQPTFPHDGFGYIEIKKSLKKIKNMSLVKLKALLKNHLNKS